MFKNLMCFLLFLLLVSCSRDGRFLYEDTTPPQPVSDKEYLVEDLFGNSTVSILWVIDNSGSMRQIHNNIVTNSKLFMQEFIKESSISWNMGVVSTDERQRPFLGFSPLFTNRSSQVVKTLQDTVNSLGTNGSGFELVFYNMHRHLDQNPKFIQSQSPLAVILVTDEREQSSRKGSLFNPKSLVPEMQKMISNGQIFRVYGAFSARDFKACNGRYYSDFNYQGSRYKEIIEMTGGFSISACSATFGKDLARISEDIVKLVKFPIVRLTERPLRETIKVVYEGKVIPGGLRSDGGNWFYNPLYNTINFTNTDFLGEAEGQRIRILFDVDDGHERESPQG